MTKASDRAFIKKAMAFLARQETSDRQFGIKQAATILRLRRTLTAIAETPMPPNRLDAYDRLDRIKRRATSALANR